MNMKVNLDVVAAALEAALDSAFCGFKQNPNTENFAELHTAMHAHQYWCGLDCAARTAVSTRLWEIPVSKWTGTLKDTQVSEFSSKSLGTRPPR